MKYVHSRGCVTVRVDADRTELPLRGSARPVSNTDKHTHNDVEVRLNYCQVLATE